MKNTSTFLILFLFSIFINIPLRAQQSSYVFRAENVFDGNQMQMNWIVLVEGDHISYAGPAEKIKPPENAIQIDVGNGTLLPGLIEGHSHLLLHPYNETSWNDQVLVESRAERCIRAGVHATRNLMAGFTTIRDLGTEGADYDDIGIKEAIEKGIIPGPRMIVAGRAIVATGSYGPKGFAPQVAVPLGAETADGYDDLIRVVRDQIGHGVEVVKVYADYRWGPQKQAMPTFSEEELTLIVKTTKSSGRDVVAHASTAEGMRRAILAGVKTIEHGDEGTHEIFQLMVEKKVALCPTLAAGDAISQYRGWKKGLEEEPDRIRAKRESFAAALSAGVQICAGGDVGVFPHGENARELEMMVEYGMPALEVLKSATQVNAEVFGYGDQLGQIKKGWLADLIIVEGRPDQDISVLKKVKFVMKNGAIYRNDL